MKNNTKRIIKKLLLRHKAKPGEVRINRASCDGCGVCANICPQKVLVIKEISDEEFSDLSLKGKLKVIFKGKNKAYVNNADDCICCSLCEENCHEAAIWVG